MLEDLNIEVQEVEKNPVFAVYTANKSDLQPDEITDSMSKAQ